MKNLFYIVLAVVFVSVTAFAAVSSFPYSYNWTGAASISGDGNYSNTTVGGGFSNWITSATGGNGNSACAKHAGDKGNGKYADLNVVVDLTGKTLSGNEYYAFWIKKSATPLAGNSKVVFLIDGVGKDSSDLSTATITTTGGVYTLSLAGLSASVHTISIRYLSTNNATNGPDLFVDDNTFDGGALPIQLSSFTGVALENTVQLDWATESETNNYGFYVERMNENEATYTELSFVAGAGTTLEPQVYTYVDENVASGKYYYRLRQVDLNGDFTYSQPIQVVVNGVLAVGDNVGPVVFKLNQNYPNPFNPSTEIKYSVATAGLVTLKVYNLIGQEVASLVNQEQPAGFHTVTFDASNLSSGIYVYRLSSGAETAIKSMMLVK